MISDGMPASHLQAAFARLSTSDDDDDDRDDDFAESMYYWHHFFWVFGTYSSPIFTASHAHEPWEIPFL